MTDIRIAMLSSSTIDFLQKPFSASLEARGLRASFWIGGFAQFRQDILNPDSRLYEKDPAFVILCLDGADLFQEILANPFDFLPDARRDLAVRCASEIAALAEVLAERLPFATVLLNTVAMDVPSAAVGLEYNSDFGLQDVASTYNAELSVLVRRLQTVVIVDVASLAASVGFERWRDSRMWYLARSHWSRQALQALAERYTATIAGKLGLNRKCIVLDLDNTLWGGVVGEDGSGGLQLGEEGIGRAYIDFQMELLNLQRKGILLAICSKNNAEDALGVIRNHTAMRLREKHFAAVRINWEDKATNLRELAKDLNIGLNSLLFLDDNPVERSWVSQNVPEVLVPDWPSDPADYKTALLELSSRYFCTSSITVEDRQRGEAYQAQAERRRHETSASSIEDFYQTLQMRARVGYADPLNIPRIAQLTQKTNQFNLTTRRYTEAEIEAISHDRNSAIFWLELSDRFGPSGIVGVLILRRKSSDSWLIDTFLLSCRVMGRTAENAFLAIAATELGAAKLIGEFRPTAKNLPVRDLYARLGFEPARQDPDAEFWEMDLVGHPLKAPTWFEISIVRGGVVA